MPHKDPPKDRDAAVEWVQVFFSFETKGPNSRQRKKKRIKTRARFWGCPQIKERTVATSHGVQLTPLLERPTGNESLSSFNAAASSTANSKHLCTRSNTTIPKPSKQLTIRGAYVCIQTSYIGEVTK